MTKKQVRINIRSLANSAAIKSVMRNGRKHIIVPSATLPDDVVMNGIKYPADEIEKSYKGLNRKPAPLGHPTANGRFISAQDPEGINLAWVGAWNENVRRENGRVFLDKVIDVAVAERTDNGKQLLNAIEQGEPIHTSTGLLCYLENAEADDHDYIAREIEFDHDAILLGEEGAATPDQGVGMMVNAAGTEIEVINSALEDAERDLEWAADLAVRAIERMERAPMLDRIKSALVEVFRGGQTRETTANQGDSAMADEKQFEALSAKVDALSETMTGLGETITNAITEGLKPMKDAHDEVLANQKAEAEAKRAAAVNKLVATGQWTEEELADMPMAAINKLVEKAKPGKAAPVNGAEGGAGGDDEFAGYDLNEAMKEANNA